MRKLMMVVAAMVFGITAGCAHTYTERTTVTGPDGRQSSTERTVTEEGISPSYCPQFGGAVILYGQPQPVLQGSYGYYPYYQRYDNDPYWHSQGHYYR